MLFIICGIQLTVSQDKSLTEFNFETELIKPVKVVKIKEDHYFIDFGKAFFGTLSIESDMAQKDIRWLCI